MISGYGRIPYEAQPAGVSHEYKPAGKYGTKTFFFFLLNFLHIFYQYKEMKKQFWFVLIYACCMQILINQLCIQGQSGASYQPEAPGLGHAGQVGSKHGKAQLCVSGVYTV